MGFIKQDIRKRYNPITKRFQGLDNTHLTLDPYYHKEYPSFLTEDECKHLSKVIQEDAESIKQAHPLTSNQQNSYTGLTQYFEVYNWLNHPKVALLNIPQRLLELPEFDEWNSAMIQCWCNILHQGQDLPEHTHSGQATQYAINIFIEGNPSTGTTYEGKTIPNTLGTLTMLGSSVLHQVKTNIHQTPRISMALDVHKGCKTNKESMLVHHSSTESMVNRFQYYTRDIQ